MPSLPAGEVRIEVRGDKRIIESNGIPNHTPGAFPNRGNPHAIEVQVHRFEMTTSPELRPADARAASLAEPPRGRPGHFGVALNGVVFDPGTAEIWRDGAMIRGGGPRPGDWNQEAIGPNGGVLGLDEHNAHVQPGGKYHYHGIPTGLIEQLGGRGDAMLLLGWAADGFPIYAPWGHSDPNDASSPLQDLRSSNQLKPGRRPADGPSGEYDGTFRQDFVFVEGSGDLDVFGGRFGVTPEFPLGTYHYVLTENHPFVPRSHAGTPDPSFAKTGGGGGGHRGQRGGERGGERGPRGPRGQAGDRPGSPR